MATIISKHKSGSRGYYVISGNDQLLDSLDGIYMAKRNSNGDIEANFNNKRHAAEIESAVEDANKQSALKNSESQDYKNRFKNRYVELLTVAKRDGLSHGAAWIASERDIDVHQLDPWVGGEFICYVYSN